MNMLVNQYNCQSPTSPVVLIYKLQKDKINRGACAFIEVSDQPRHPHNLKGPQYSVIYQAFGNKV